MRMGDLLRMADEHDDAEIVAIGDRDPARMADAIASFAIPSERVFTDVDQCVAATRPDLVVLCPATADQAYVVEEIARHGFDI
jgi:glucose-fructose oxidoreductase